MNPTKIVFFDIDHTLYDPSSRCVHASTIHAIEMLSRQKTVAIVIATGRAVYMLDVIEPLKSMIDGYITINGQYIVDQGVVVRDAPLNQDNVETVAKVLESEGLVFGAIGATRQSINKLDDAIIAEFDKAAMPHPHVDREFYKNHPVYQLWAFADDAMRKRIAKRLPDYPVVPWLTDGFDIIMNKQTKKEAVEFVRKRYGIPLDKVYAFGDGENDIEMLAHVPNSVAMGNASIDVKHVANHVTKACDEDGIRLALEALNLIPK